MSSGETLVKTVANEAAPKAESQLPPDVLRFELEYESAPDVLAEKNKLKTFLGIQTSNFFQFMTISVISWSSNFQR